MPSNQITKQSMSSYSNLKTVKQIISGSPKLSDMLLSFGKYLAHTPDEGLVEHTDLTLKYLNAIIEANNLDGVIDRLIVGIIPNRNDVIKESVKELFTSTILFHDFGKINANFQVEKMNNLQFEKNVDKISSKHSLLGSYIFLVYKLNFILKQSFNQEDKTIIFGFSLLFSFAISNHHKSEFTITFSKNEFEKYIDEFAKYLKTFSFQIDSKFEKQLFIGLDQKLKQASNFIAKQNQNEFNQWCLLKLLYSLLTASDYYATNHYKSGLQQIYSSHEFGVIDSELSQRMIDSFATTKDYNQKLISDYIQYLEIPLSQLQEPSFKNICLLRQKLGAEIIEGINRNPEERVYYIEAPTGGGKTNLSMLAITEILKNKPNETTKVFYVFSFTTLITQTYSALKETLSLTNEEVIQIHSKAGFHSKKEDEKDGLYGNEKQNFIDYLFINYPLCLMSHIKFFDIVKTNNKETNYLLHRLANSIVVIDELQTYSPSEWDKLKYFISNFAQSFNMRFIIMSATLPKIHSIAVGYSGEFRPLIKDVQNRFLQNPNFRDRVSFDFSLIDKYDDKISIDDLSKQVLSLSSQYAKEKGSVHTIIEFIHKKSTTEFYDSVIQLNVLFAFDEIFILSGTILEPRRKEIIDFLKDNKNKSKNILLITTQVVEAGVDIDMDLGFKNISLLDSDEQLAGRVNRNANKERCTLFLFRKDEPFRVYKNDFRYDFSRTMYKNKTQRSQILENKDFRLLYELVIGKINRENQLEFTKNFQDYTQSIKNLNYKVVSEEFKLIDSDNISFFVPLDLDLKFDENGILKNFSEKEYHFLQNKDCVRSNVVIGAKVWALYNSVIDDKSANYMMKIIEIKILNGIISKFTFSMFRNEKIENDLAPYLEYNEESKGFKINGYYCFNTKYNQIYSYETGLDEKSVTNSYIIF